MSTATDSTDLAFKRWEQDVDREVSKLVGLGLFDLPDCTTRDWFDDGVEVETAARWAIRSARNLGFFGR